LKVCCVNPNDPNDLNPPKKAEHRAAESLFRVRDMDLARDLESIAEAYREGFFAHEPTDGIRWFTREMMGLIVRLADFVLVAESADGIVRGYIVGRFAEGRQPSYRLFATLLRFGTPVGVRYMLNRYRLPSTFRAEFRNFVRRVGQLEIGKGIPADAEVTNLAAQTAWRKGIGTALMDAFMARCRENRCRTVKVLTETVVNYPFYEKYGFVRVHEKAMSGVQPPNIALVYLYTIAEA
jgi:GNAT superfamily N-acetyltransferase